MYLSKIVGVRVSTTYSCTVSKTSKHNKCKGFIRVADLFKTFGDQDLVLHILNITDFYLPINNETITV